MREVGDIIWGRSRVKPKHDEEVICRVAREYQTSPLHHVTEFQCPKCNLTKPFYNVEGYANKDTDFTCNGIVILIHRTAD